MALMAVHAGLLQRDVLFFVDNSVSLFSCVKGTSNEAHVARSAQLAALVNFTTASRTWFEFVDSKSNWADGISRLLAHDKFCLKHQIPVSQVYIEPYWWQAPVHDVYEVIQQFFGEQRWKYEI